MPMKNTQDAPGPSGPVLRIVVGGLPATQIRRGRGEIGRTARRLVAAVLLALPAASAAGEGAAHRFRMTDATRESGIDFRMTCGRMPSREILEVNGGGVALTDFDNDGDWDLFFANGATWEAPQRGEGCRLYANRGDGTFEDVTASAGIDAVRGWAMGVAVGDVDGDGWDDLYVTCYGPNVLLRNVAGDAGRRRFVDVTAEAGVGDDRWSTSAAFGDIDSDGDLDLYVANYLVFDVKRPPDRTGKFFKGAPVMAGPSGLTAQDDALFENLGGGRFRDITRAAGIVEKTPGYGLGVRFLDYDRDGRIDIFVGNDSTENYLFRNLGGQKFEELGVIAGVAANYEGTTQATMGIALGDVDGNGALDIFTTNFSSDTNTLHANLGDGFFDDRTSQFGLAAVSRPFLSWGCGFFDFDCDGDEDLFIASGHVYPEAATHKIDSEYEQAVTLMARDGRRFERVTPDDGMFRRKYHGRSIACGDIDGDGDVDVIMTTLNGPVHVFRNASTSGAALVVEFAGETGNRRGYGAAIELVTPAGIQRRWISGGGSYQSADAPQAYFGVAADAAAGDRTLRVRWPDGRTWETSDVPLATRFTIHRDPAQNRRAPLRPRAG